MQKRATPRRPRGAGATPPPAHDDARAQSPRPWARAVALVATALAAGLRIHAAIAAGPLWRDEAHSASTASVPSFAEFYGRLHFDSFPLLWQLVLRTWTTVVWDDGDVAIRTLGTLVSLLLLPALWWTSRTLGVLPLASLVFAGVAPAFVVWAGYSNRAYGLGVALLAWLVGAMWRLVDAPTPRRAALACGVAVLAVHTVYYDSVLLAALGGGAAAVALRRRSWQPALHAGGVGIVAALSLLVYAPVLTRTAELAKLVYAPVGLADVARGLRDTLAAGGEAAFWSFVVLALAACVGGVVFGTRGARDATSRDADPDARAREVVLFVAAATACALAGQVVFLLRLSFLVQPWYYVGLVLLAAVAVDVVAQRAPELRALVPAYAAAMALLLAGSSLFSYTVVGRRQSNLDLIARRLHEEAAPGDLVVVYPWHYGVSFSRYYDGPAPFMTIPAVEDHGYHRFDQLAELMRDPERIKPGFRRIHAALAAGNRVWLVGQPLPDAPPDFPVLPPPSDEDPTSWRDGRYTAVAGLQLGWVLARQSPRAETLTPRSEVPVSPYEEASLTRYAVDRR